MQVSEIRKRLVIAGLSQEDADNIKGKKALLAKLLEMTGVEVIDELDDVNLDNAELENDEPITNEVIPSYNSPEWETYVLSQFKESELDGKHPKVNGLRRVAELLLGPIVFSGPSVVFPATDQQYSGRASCVFQLTFSPWLNGLDNTARQFSAAADSYAGNTDDKYSIFPLAIAETRAEARALRRALKLNVVASDELTDKVAQQPQAEVSKEIDWQPSEPVGSSQITILNTLCDRLNIDLDKFINSGEKKYNNIKEITKETALKMIQRLNEYQSAEKIEVPSFLLKG